MPKFKNVRIKMANGRTRLQRARVLASGKLRFVKNKTRTVHRRVKSGVRRVKHRITKRRSPSRAPISRKATKKRSNNVVGFGGIKSTLNKPIIKKVIMAAGLVSIAISVLSLISPRAAGFVSSPTGRAAVGFVGGDFIGAASQFLLSGGVGSIGGLLNGGGNGGGGTNGSNGFA